MSSLLAASPVAASAVSSPISTSSAAALNMAPMSSPNHEVALVAPRPVRISHAAFNFHLQRDADDSTASGSLASPGAGIKLTAFSAAPERTSSRASLPSEALEEFLSILTPSFIRKPRAFPAFDPRHQRSSSLTTTTTNYGYNLNRASQSSTSPVAARASPPALQLLQEQLAGRGDGALTPPRLDTGHWPFGVGARSQNPILASPVSRLHTRNPFYLHHDSPGGRFPLHPQLPPLSPSPSRSQSQTPALNLMRPLTPVTPHAVPLPSPSPDELSERLELSSI